MSFILIDDTHDQTVDGTKTFIDAVRFANGGASVYTAVKASSSLVTPWTLTLPVDGGTSGYFLQTDGSGTTTWAAAGGGGGSPDPPFHSVQWNDSGSFGGDSSFTYTSPNLLLEASLGGSSYTGLTIHNSSATVLSTAELFLQANSSGLTGIAFDLGASGARSLAWDGTSFNIVEGRALTTTQVLLRVFGASSTTSGTNLYLFDGDTSLVKKVQLGANDSGGAGFKMLRMAN